MVIKNVTKRASKAMYLLSKAHDDLEPFMHEIEGEDNLRAYLDALNYINEAQKELVKILAQDNRVEVEG